MRTYVMEFIGTFFLVLVVGLTGDPLAIGLTLMSVVYLGGHISGAHYNPAVSLAVVLRGALKKHEMMLYWIVQIAAAIAASAVVFALSGNAFVPSPKEGALVWQILLVEGLFTFVLAFVILTEGTTKKFAQKHLYGLTIGLTLAAIAYAGGPISGGAYNPAVGLGPIIFNFAMTGTFASYAWCYVAGPLAGGAFAALAYRYLDLKAKS